MMASMTGDRGSEFTRRLGSNELFCHFCHNAGNLNVMTGLTLLTRTAIDEGKGSFNGHRTYGANFLFEYGLLWIRSIWF